jgi:hypothetical protein
MPVKSHYGSAVPVRSFEREATLLAASLAPGGGPGARPPKPPSPPASWCVEARGLELVADQPEVQEHHPEVVLVSTCPLRARAAALPIRPRPAVNLVVYHGVLAPHARWHSPVVRYDRPAPDATAPAADARPRSGSPRGAWDLGGVDAPRVRPRCPRLSPLWRPAAGHRHRAGPWPSCGPSSPTAGARGPRGRLPPPHPPGPRSASLPRGPTCEGSRSPRPGPRPPPPAP